MKDHSNSGPELARALSFKAMNDKLDPGDSVPFALVFGECPEVCVKSEAPSERANLCSRPQIASEARKELEKVTAKWRIHRAVRHAKPHAGSQCVQSKGDGACKARKIF